MVLSREKKTFKIFSTVALSAVLVGGGVAGCASNQPDASASDQLPKALDSRELGDGGLEPDSIKLLTKTADYSVWTATDRANNICTIAYATPEGNTSASCDSEERFNTRAITAWMQVGEAEQGDLSVTGLQTYYFPDGVNTEAVSQMIPGSEAVGQLVVRYGPLDLEKSERRTVPKGGDKLTFTVYGRDSI